MEKMRFAPLCRVSTEAQAKKGESLAFQRQRLQDSIDALGGTVYQWYSGQEHATVDEERKILERLLQDAPNDLFDAVMIENISRWSRDNKKSKEHLDVLKKHGIRFYVCQTEYDLFQPTYSFLIGSHVEMSEFFGLEQARKSLEAKISRAKKGWPACGNPPFGRRFNKVSMQWEVIPEEMAKAESLARAYLDDNLSFKQIEARFCMKGGVPYKILTMRSGPTWEQSFHSPRLNIKETILTEVPPLLDEETLKRIREKARGRRIWDHNTPLNNYLLNRKLLDADTGNGFTGASQGGKRYYTPYKNRGPKSCFYIPADLIEERVIYALFEALDGSKSFKEAVFDNGSSEDARNELNEKQNRLKGELSRLDSELSRLVDKLGRHGGRFEEILESKIHNLNEAHSKLKFEIDTISNTIATLPTEKEIETVRTRMLRQLRKSFLTSATLFHKLPFEKKKDFLNLIFGGEDENGKRYGIYVRRLKKKEFHFEAYGKIGSFEGWFGDKTEEPLSIRTLSKNPEIGKAAKILQNQRQTMDSKLDLRCLHNRYDLK